MTQGIARGKPADYGQLIVERRARLTRQRVALRDKNVLDFGCGNGAQTVEFQNEGAHITALDIDAADLSVLSDYLDENRIHTILPLLYDGSIIPLDDESMDVVISYEVLEHVHDEAASLGEINRVLKKQGEFVFSVPNKWWIFETHGAHLPWLPWNRIPFFSWLPRKIHQKYAKARIYRKRDIIQICEQCGLRVLDIAYITAPMDVVKSKILKRFLRKYFFRGDTTIFPLLSTAILVQGKKV